MTVEARDIVKSRADYRVIVLIGASIGFAIIVLAGMAATFSRVNSGVTPASTLSLLLVIFLVLGAGCVVASVGLRRRAVAKVRGSGNLPAALMTLRTGIIVSCAIAEVPATLGLVYIFLGGSMMWMPAFFGGALLALAAAVPRPAQWDEWLASVSAPIG
jgi:F0F1-type ATP synthase membrane subunit c/vacuolar-type H+-ATPase subunit K